MKLKRADPEVRRARDPWRGGGRKREIESDNASQRGVRPLHTALEAEEGLI